MNELIFPSKTIWGLVKFNGRHLCSKNYAIEWKPFSFPERIFLDPFVVKSNLTSIDSGLKCAEKKELKTSTLNAELPLLIKMLNELAHLRASIGHKVWDNSFSPFATATLGGWIRNISSKDSK